MTRFSNPRRSATPLLSLLSLLLATGGSVPAFAQQAGSSPVSQAQIERPDAVNDLNAHLARLATDPRDVEALIGAGEAALALDDGRAATGFFARADAITSGDGRIKAGLGRAMVKTRNPAEALRLFDQATRLGYPETGFLADRALARDLTGDPAGAQRDYQAALKMKPDDEDLIEDYALSLGISGQVDAANKVLEPLLFKSDRTAWRNRVFILAMNGRKEQAQELATRTMPAALAQAIQPYLDRMQALNPAQRAAAVHFGVFPSDTEIRSAAAAPQPAPPPAAPPVVPAATSGRTELAANDARPAGEAKAKDKAATAPEQTADTGSSRRRGERLNPRVGRKIADAPDAAQEKAAEQQSRTATEKPAVTPAPARATSAPERQAAPALSDASSPLPGSSARQVQGPPVPEVAKPQVQSQVQPQVQGPPSPEPVPSAAARPSQIAAATPPPPPQAAPSSSPEPAAPQAIDTQSVRTLSDIIRELKVPEAEKRASPGAVDLAGLQAIQAQKRREREDKAKQEAAAKAKAEAAAKAKAAAEEKKRLAQNPSRNWVQVGTGRDLSALGFTMKRLRGKYEALAKRDAWTASWGATRRLVVGPFPSFDKAREFEARLKQAGTDAFAWQSDAGEEVTRLSDK